MVRFLMTTRRQRRQNALLCNIISLYRGGRRCALFSCSRFAKRDRETDRRSVKIKSNLIMEKENKAKNLELKCRGILWWKRSTERSSSYDEEAKLEKKKKKRRSECQDSSLNDDAPQVSITLFSLSVSSPGDEVFYFLHDFCLCLLSALLKEGESKERKKSSNARTETSLVSPLDPVRRRWWRRAKTIIVIWWGEGAEDGEGEEKRCQCQ